MRLFDSRHLLPLALALGVSPLVAQSYTWPFSPTSVVPKKCVAFDPHGDATMDAVILRDNATPVVLFAPALFNSFSYLNTGHAKDLAVLRSGTPGVGDRLAVVGNNDLQLVNFVPNVGLVPTSYPSLGLSGADVVAAAVVGNRHVLAVAQGSQVTVVQELTVGALSQVSSFSAGGTVLDLAFADWSGNGVADLGIQTASGLLVTTLAGATLEQLNPPDGSGQVEMYDFDVSVGTDPDYIAWYRPGTGLLDLRSGAGSFANISLALEPGTALRSVTACLVDGNSLTDLVVKQSSGIQLFTGKAPVGTFSTSVVSGISYGAADTARPAIADFDGDGLPDLLDDQVTSGTVELIKGFAAPSPQEPNTPTIGLDTCSIVHSGSHSSLTLQMDFERGNYDGLQVVAWPMTEDPTVPGNDQEISSTYEWNRYFEFGTGTVSHHQIGIELAADTAVTGQDDDLTWPNGDHYWLAVRRVHYDNGNLTVTDGDPYEIWGMTVDKVTNTPAIEGYLLTLPGDDTMTEIKNGEAGSTGKSVGGILIKKSPPPIVPGAFPSRVGADNNGTTSSW